MYEFQKMHGLGNHFIFFDEMRQDFSKLKKPLIVKTLCDVKRGLGADGLVFIMDPTNSKNQCRMQIFNADGSEAEICGNAVRGVAHNFKKHNRGIDPMMIETKAGIREVTSTDVKDGVCFYKVEMGKANFDLVGTGELLPEEQRKPLEWQDDVILPVYVHVGNPHAVIFLYSSIDENSVISLGTWLETHKNHPKRINVEFVEVISKHEVKVIVWERGCGLTSACGTGATAVAAVGMNLGKLESPVTVHMPGGDLEISGNPKKNMFMNGPIQEIADGRLTPGFVDWILSQKE